MIYQYDVINVIIEKDRAIVIFSDPDYQNYHNDHQDYHNSQHIGRNHICQGVTSCVHERGRNQNIKSPHFRFK